MGVADAWAIEAVLSLFKHLELKNLRIAGLTRSDSKTFRFLTSLGYTVQDVFACLRSLELADYVNGPLPDDKGRSRDVWIFGKRIEGIEAYIKFTICLSGTDTYVVCISFHEAEWPLSYPFKKA